jgi:hypothetical protein
VKNNYTAGPDTSERLEPGDEEILDVLKGDEMDDLKNKGPQDRARINVHEAHEVEYWTKKLGVSREKLEAAVKKVGVSAEAVEKELA